MLKSSTSKIKKFKCQHCNNETIMEVVSSIQHDYSDRSKDDYYYEIQSVLLCPICDQYNIISAYWDNTYGKLEYADEYDLYGGDNVDESIIFPIHSNLVSSKSDLVPDTIIKTFRKAIELKLYDEESCLIKLRKTLELICNDQNADGNNLLEKITNISEKGIIPVTLTSASTIIRKLGNIGAHESDININSNEIKCVIELVEYIIQYIYVLPKEIEKIDKKFNLISK
ncbi:putative uncharacterized protein [Coprobacillus sp. CAG:605]|nr:putative uncharacterized protein [Coprobacillus sp. CAG:605]